VVGRGEDDVSIDAATFSLAGGLGAFV
jgi:hypothetical protein